MNNIKIVPIIKAEFSYYRFSMLFALIVLISLVAGILGWGWSGIQPDIPGIFTIIAVITIVLWFTRFLNMIKEKAERLHAVLPLAKGEIALARILVMDIFWFFVLMLFWGLFFILKFQEFQTSVISYSFSITGIMISLITYPFIHRDLLYCFTGKYQKILVTCIYVLVLLFIMFLFSLSSILRYFPGIASESVLPVQASFSEFIWMPFGAFFFLLLGIGLSGLNIFVYQKRKFYLE